MSFEVEKYRQDFELFGDKKVNGRDLVYLDNAATTLKPNAVAEAVDHHYRLGTSNVHRGVHYLSEQATVAYENARKKIGQFLGTANEREIIFTSGTTHGVNLLATSLGAMLKPGDEILISEMEHHSNIVPWQMLAERQGLELRVVPLTREGHLDMDAFNGLLSTRTKILAVTYVSNALGTINPIKSMIADARQKGCMVVVDGAQAVAHIPVDVKDLDCDFFVLSGHKLFGPTGIGVLYGKEELLNEMPPAYGGGGMIRSVSFKGTTFAESPEKFEAGTPHIAGAIGLGASIDYLNKIGMDRIAEYEDTLTQYGLDKLSRLDGINLIGPDSQRSCIFSFTVDGVHPHDVGTILDSDGVATRSGHHCCQPIMDYFNVPATSRASLSFYNTKEDIDRLCEGLRKVQGMFR